MQYKANLRIAVSLALAGAMVMVPARAAAQGDTKSAADARAQYNVKQSGIYNYKFGNEHPYLPSNATTDTGAFIDPKNFPTAQYCGHCHQEAHAEWRQSPDQSTILTDLNSSPKVSKPLHFTSNSPSSH